MMLWKPALLWTDLFIYFFTVCILAALIMIKRSPSLRSRLRHVIIRPIGMMSLVILTAYFSIAFLDSIHMRPLLQQAVTQKASENQPVNKKIYYAAQAMSLLDILIAPVGQQYEKSYSAPFSLYLLKGGSRLKHAGSQLNSPSEKTRDIVKITLWAVLRVMLFSGLLAFVFMGCYKLMHWLGRKAAADSNIAWRYGIITAISLLIIGSILFSLSQHYHVLGTDKVGQDVLYEAIKSIRTGWIIGVLTLFIMLPFAILLGMLAGYWGGWIDDIIQYIYTTLSSVPGVLLIAAAVLSLQVMIAKHAEFFSTLNQRADAQLLALCLVLGMTNWTPLCRLLRGETLKLRESAFVESAIALGVSHRHILYRHILPNVMHLILITAALDFSMLVLAEAVLSYIGIGVDPSIWSWGNMINAARMELAREPVVWWPLVAAFTFMFMLVLASNLFADALRDALDPHEHIAR